MRTSYSRKNPRKSVSRREFLRYSALAAGALALPGCSHPWPGRSQAAPAVRRIAPNEKLNVAVIGVAGRGGGHLKGFQNENIVALCDVDEVRLRKAAEQFPNARLFRDYRRMLDLPNDIDAVSIATPDHHHALPAMMAMESGRHVYCEKPLTHSIYEARLLTDTARRCKVATQMGNQGHAGDGVRQLCSMIWSGAIGPVREVHCWTDRPIWPQGLDRPRDTPPVPGTLDWDMWVGPAPMRPYHPAYVPFKWRGWWDFGCGALGDMGCHVMDGPNWALKLGAPASVEMLDSSGVNSETAPTWSIVRYEFPAREGLPPVTLTWYEGGKKPVTPHELGSAALEKNGSLFIGDNGKILAGTYCENPRLLPTDLMKDYQMPELAIPRSPGAFEEFILACKGGKPAESNFDYSGPFTEMVLLGNIAMRAGQKVQWNARGMQVTNVRDAQQYVRRAYRNGWEV